MSHGLRTLDAVQAVRDRPVAARLGDEPVGERRGGFAHAVELGPVAGRDDQGLGDSGQRTERGERTRQALGIEHDALAHLDRRGAVIQADDEEAT